MAAGTRLRIGVPNRGIVCRERNVRVAGHASNPRVQVLLVLERVLVALRPNTKHRRARGDEQTREKNEAGPQHPHRRFRSYA